MRLGKTIDALYVVTILQKPIDNVSTTNTNPHTHIEFYECDQIVFFFRLSVHNDSFRAPMPLNNVFHVVTVIRILLTVIIIIVILIVIHGGISFWFCLQFATMNVFAILKNHFSLLDLGMDTHSLLHI